MKARKTRFARFGMHSPHPCNTRGFSPHICGTSMGDARRQWCLLRVRRLRCHFRYSRRRHVHRLHEPQRTVPMQIEAELLCT